MVIRVYFFRDFQVTARNDTMRIWEWEVKKKQYINPIWQWLKDLILPFYENDALFITLAVGLISCSKTITCMDPPIGLAFISFPLSDIDTLVIKKFSPGSNFQHVIDSISFFSNVTGSTVSWNDTTRISLNNQIGKWNLVLIGKFLSRLRTEQSPFLILSKKRTEPKSVPPCRKDAFVIIKYGALSWIIKMEISVPILPLFYL